MASKKKEGGGEPSLRMEELARLQPVEIRQLSFTQVGRIADKTLEKLFTSFWNVEQIQAFAARQVKYSEELDQTIARTTAEAQQHAERKVVARKKIEEKKNEQKEQILHDQELIKRREQLSQTLSSAFNQFVAELTPAERTVTRGGKQRVVRLLRRNMQPLIESMRQLSGSESMAGFRLDVDAEGRVVRARPYWNPGDQRVQDVLERQFYKKLSGKFPSVRQQIMTEMLEEGEQRERQRIERLRKEYWEKFIRDEVHALTKGDAPVEMSDREIARFDDMIADVLALSFPNDGTPAMPPRQVVDKLQHKYKGSLITETQVKKIIREENIRLGREEERDYAPVSEWTEAQQALRDELVGEQLKSIQSWLDTSKKKVEALRRKAQRETNRDKQQTMLADALNLANEIKSVRLKYRHKIMNLDMPGLRNLLRDQAQTISKAFAVGDATEEQLVEAWRRAEIMGEHDVNEQVAQAQLKRASVSVSTKETETQKEIAAAAAAYKQMERDAGELFARWRHQAYKQNRTMGWAITGALEELQRNRKPRPQVMRYNSDTNMWLPVEFGLYPKQVKYFLDQHDRRIMVALRTEGKTFAAIMDHLVNQGVRLSHPDIEVRDIRRVVDKYCDVNRMQLPVEWTQKGRTFMTHDPILPSTVRVPERDREGKLVERMIFLDGLTPRRCRTCRPRP